MFKEIKCCLFTSSTDTITLLLFEKEKGGTGGTGSAMSVAEMLIGRNVPVTIVDMASLQLDLYAPYKGVQGVKVVEFDVRAYDASRELMRAVINSGPGSVVIVNVPGGAAEDMVGIHDFVTYAQELLELTVNVSIIWTLGADACSVDTLNVMLDMDPPGPVHVNLPDWHPGHAAYENNVALREKVRAQGGVEVRMPRLTTDLHSRFAAEKIAPATMMKEMDIIEGAFIAMWRRSVAEALGVVS